MNKLKKHASTAAAPPPAKKELTTSEYAAMLTALLGRLGDGPGAADRAFYASTISDAEAQSEGTRVESGAVVAEWCRVAKIVADAVLAGAITGCGPVRFHYACGLALKLTEQIAVHDQIVVSAAGASHGSSSSLMNSRSARRVAIRALRSLAGRNAAARARLRAAAAQGERPDERSRSLNALAAELEHVLKTLPPGVVADAGITPALVESLRAAARAVVAAKSTQTSERGAIASSYDVLNTLDGRVLHEMRNLVTAAREARRAGGKVPAVSSSLIASRSAKKASAKKPVAPIVTPVQRPSGSSPVS